MNESLSVCAVSLCCCLVVCSLVRLVAPAGNTTKIFSLVIGVFTICCLISPFVTLVKNYDMYAYSKDFQIKQSDLSQKYNDEVLRTTGNYINSYAQTLLLTAEIRVNDISTTMAVDKDNGIYIKEMNIHINKNSSYKYETIEELIESSVGIKPKIRVN